MNAFLIWLAGADKVLLDKCPRSDYLFIHHLGISLVLAGIFIFSITFLSFSFAIPDLESIGFWIVGVFSAMIALTVMMIDRLFIVADWKWQAQNSRGELESKLLENKSEQITKKFLSRHSDKSALARSFYRSVAVVPRLLLSAAIGLSLGTFLELYLYKDEIRPMVEKLHYRDNAEAYDKIEKFVADYDAKAVRAESALINVSSRRDQLDNDIIQRMRETKQSTNDPDFAIVDKQIAEIDQRIYSEEQKRYTFEQDMIAESEGVVINQGNTGKAGKEKKYRAALAQRDLATREIDALKSQRQDLIGVREGVANRLALEAEGNRITLDRDIQRLREERAALVDDLDEQRLLVISLGDERRTAISEYTDTLRQDPSFADLSFGLIAQLRAMHELYKFYGIHYEAWMIKLLIMLLEMAPVIQKIFLSPVTLYPVLLHTGIRSRSYDKMNEELAARRNYMNQKFNAGFDETAAEYYADARDRTD